MIYRVRKLHYLTQSIIPAGWLVIVVWLTLKKSQDIGSILLAAGIATAFLVIFIYAMIKQLKTPLIETTDTKIKVHNVWKKPDQVTWDLIIGIKKYPLLGYKLETISGGIWLPIGMLTKVDVMHLLDEVRCHVEK